MLEENFLIFNPDTVWNSNYLDCIRKMENFYHYNKIKNILLVVNKKLSFDQTLKGDFKLDMNKLSKNINNQYHIGTFLYICNIIQKIFDEIYCSLTLADNTLKKLQKGILHYFYVINNHYENHKS